MIQVKNSILDVRNMGLANTEPAFCLFPANGSYRWIQRHLACILCDKAVVMVANEKKETPCIYQYIKVITRNSAEDSDKFICLFTSYF